MKIYDPLKKLFQSTPPARGATYDGAGRSGGFSISIHAPREGGDRCIRHRGDEEGVFQSTPPARGATRYDALMLMQKADFNPRPPRGGRRKRLFIPSPTQYISIHAPREGGDGVCGGTGSSRQ